MNDTHCAHFSPYLGWKKFSEKTLLLKFRENSDAVHIAFVQ